MPRAALSVHPAWPVTLPHLQPRATTLCRGAAVRSATGKPRVATCSVFIQCPWLIIKGGLCKIRVSGLRIEVRLSQRDAVGKSYPAVEESYHAVGSFSHGCLLTARRPVENRCYVKKFTNDVIFFTYYVIFFT